MLLFFLLNLYNLNKSFMYKNRKKMYWIGLISASIITIFGVASWKIIEIAQKVDMDDPVGSKISGATAYLGDEGSFKYKKESLNDWILYNMPTLLEIDKKNDQNETDLKFYRKENQNQQKLLFSFSKSMKDNILKTVQQPNILNLVTTSNFLFQNEDKIYTYKTKYFWTGEKEYDYTFVFGDNKWNFTINNQKITYEWKKNREKMISTFTIESNTNVVLWQRIFTRKIDFDFNSDFTIDYISKTLNQEKKISVEYKYQNQNDKNHFEISYFSVEGQSKNKLNTLSDLLEKFKTKEGGYLIQSGIIIPYIPLFT